VKNGGFEHFLCSIDFYGESKQSFLAHKNGRRGFFICFSRGLV